MCMFGPGIVSNNGFCRHSGVGFTGVINAMLRLNASTLGRHLINISWICGEIDYTNLLWDGIWLLAFVTPVSPTSGVGYLHNNRCSVIYMHEQAVHTYERSILSWWLMRCHLLHLFAWTRLISHMQNEGVPLLFWRSWQILRNWIMRNSPMAARSQQTHDITPHCTGSTNTQACLLWRVE